MPSTIAVHRDGRASDHGDATPSFFSREAFAGDPGRACHGIALRVPLGVDAQDIRANLDKLAAEQDALRGLRLWVPPVEPANGETPTGGTRADEIRTGETRAAEARDRELRRALSPGGPGLRAVLLRHADGPPVLVLTGHRAVLGYAGLERLATALVDPATPAPVVGSLAVPHAGRATGAGVRGPGWGLGEEDRAGRHGGVPVHQPQHVSDATLLAAVDLMLARYGTGEGSPVALVRSGTCAGPLDEVTTWAVDAGDSDTAGTLLARAGRVTGHDPEAGPGRDEVSATGQDGGTPVFGVVLTGSGDAASYEPCARPMFPVTLWWDRAGDGTVHGELRYDETALSPSIAAQFARHLGDAVTALHALPGDAPAADAAPLTSGEIGRILAAGTSPPPSTAVPATVHGAFEAVAARAPEAVAYRDADGELTYARLDRRAEHCARGLRALGVAAGDRVGVCLERGADLVVTLLAVLKTGAAYVPMDVRHPVERLRYTTEDAGLDVVVTGLPGFPAPEGTRLVTPAELDRPGGEASLWAAAGAEPQAGREPVAGPEDAAYVIYTSGSTGRPKGVIVPHRNVIALLAATQGDMGLGERDVWTWYHSSAFDFSVWEIWGCLLTGGRLVGVPYAASRSPEDFIDILVAEGVTVLSQTPSAFTQVIEAGGAGRAGMAVRLVILGGEPLDVRTLRRWFRDRSHVSCRVVNMYGITETTVHVTSQTVTPREVVAGSRSVGRALPGWSVSVRDAAGRPLPFGVAGEIYVGGAGVALRYLGKPELTAERFAEDRFGGGRIYRSGDLGRMRPDGALDHLGRLDDQIQLRGHRIELDEIRSVLLEVPAVRAAAVVAATGPRGGSAAVRLDAYVVLDGACSTAEIRGVLARHLPDYMLPSTITVIGELPLTINGKVDTARLPAPRLGSAPAEPEDTRAGDGLLATLRRAWEHVFGVAVSLDDDFFELGGNSLLAVQLSAAARASGTPGWKPQDLYRNPTIRSLAAALPVERAQQ
ncbi:amino acid adenylation domain-containing protein [Sphaerisporangium corydalis]|uniref:Amino acid adenylation domain-containing protein n=1 Tax=Sphaerisporangium corydalis TaxID=1441875 RepID=A0ABV9ERF1_9ACTN|nr:amino acid adenylation domain-containing protein [Sphaerisporangium corydalis]